LSAGRQGRGRGGASAAATLSLSRPGARQRRALARRWAGPGTMCWAARSPTSLPARSSQNPTSSGDRTTGRRSTLGSEDDDGRPRRGSVRGTMDHSARELSCPRP
jgi:hypothetical protein